MGLQFDEYIYATLVYSHVYIWQGHYENCSRHGMYTVVCCIGIYNATL